MNFQLDHKSPSAIVRAARTLARKKVAREQRVEAKELAAERIPFSGHESDAPLPWHKLILSGATRPMFGFPWERPWLFSWPWFLHPFHIRKEAASAKTA